MTYPIEVKRKYWWKFIVINGDVDEPYNIADQVTAKTVMRRFIGSRIFSSIRVFSWVRVFSRVRVSRGSSRVRVSRGSWVFRGFRVVRIWS